MSFTRPIISSTCTLVILLLISCSVYSQDWGKISDEEWRAGAPEDYPEANAIILFDKAAMHVGSDVIKIDYHTRVKILNQAGVEEAGDWSLTFDEEYDKVKGFKAHTITPDGKKHKVEKDAIFEKEVGRWTERSFTFPALEPGTILEYKYQIRTERFWYLKPRFFQNYLYTMLSEFSVTLVAGWSYDVSYQNIHPRLQTPVVVEVPNPNPTFGHVSKMKKYTWKLVDLVPMNDEPYMSSIDDYRSSMRFQIESYRTPTGIQTFKKSWSEIGEDLQRDFGTYFNKGGKLKDIVTQITAGLTDDRDKSRALFDYVKSEIATLEHNYWYWFAHEKFSKLLEVQGETASGKNLLLAELHKEAGLVAYPVLISTRANGKLDPSFPNIQQFNRVVAFVQLGNEWEFLDTSNRNAVYGLLPPYCLSDAGLLIDGKQSELVRVTTKSANSYRADETRMHVDAEGLVTCSTSCQFSGYCAASYGRQYDESKPDEFVEERIIDKLDVPCNLGDYHCEMDSLNEFHMYVNYTSEDLARSLDDNILVKPVSYDFRTNPFESERRYFPVDFAYPRVYLNTVRIFSEDEAVSLVLPEDILKERAGITFKRNSYIEDSCVVVVSRLEIAEPLFSPREYGSLRHLFEDIAIASEDEVAIVLSESDL